MALGTEVCTAQSLWDMPATILLPSCTIVLLETVSLRPLHVRPIRCYFNGGKSSSPRPLAASGRCPLPLNG